MHRDLQPNERCSRRSRPSRWVVYRRVESPAAELRRWIANMEFVRDRFPLMSALLITVACAGIPRPETATLPVFDQRSITNGFTSALVGTVVDSASGSPMEHAQVLLRSRTVSGPACVFTDSRGGFVLSRLEPGRYSLLIRSLNYAPLADSVTMVGGGVDTLRARLRRLRSCGGIDCQ
jgi:hypothetical protein